MRTAFKGFKGVEIAINNMPSLLPASKNIVVNALRATLGAGERTGWAPKQAKREWGSV